MATLRNFAHWQVGVPSVKGLTWAQYLEDDAEKIAWLELDHLANVPEAGRALFVGTLAQRNLLYREFRAYVGIARTYWQAAKRTDGSAAALPLYYAFLNLAKAELLVGNPGAVTGGVKIRHGIFYKSSASTKLGGDFVQFSDGVFKLLVAKRTGHTYKNTDRFPIKNLLSLPREVGLEVEQLGAARPNPAIGYHALVNDGTSAWPLLLLDNFKHDVNESLSRAMSAHFEDLPLSALANPPYVGYKDIFALSRRSQLGALSLHQSKKIFAGPAGPDYSGGDEHLSITLGHHLEIPPLGGADFHLNHSPYKSKRRPLPMSMVRYALVFYLSSLVRYKPASLDHVLEAHQAWLWDSFVVEVPTLLLIDFVGNIQGRLITFERSGYRL
jgi:hypothetical protein